MPLYDYSCPDCGTTNEEFHKMSAAAIETCPDCGGNKYHRLINSFRMGIVKEAEVDNGEITKKAHYDNTGERLREGDQVFQSPVSGDTIHLSGSKANRKDEVVRLLIRDGYAISSSKDVELPNL